MYHLNVPSRSDSARDRIVQTGMSEGLIDRASDGARETAERWEEEHCLGRDCI